MAKLVKDSSLTAVADAIRAKGGTSGSLAFPKEFIHAVNDLPNGNNVQPDWNINDPLNPAYIKNRPFYDTGELEEVEIVPEFIGNFALPEYGLNENYLMGRDYICQENIFIFNIGDSFSIYWDGVKYNTTAYKLFEMPVLGNSAMFGGDDTGEPFAIGPDGYHTEQTDATHTIRVIQIRKKIKTIPDDFISQEIKQKTGKAVAAYAEIFNDYVNNKASGVSSHAEGYYTTASGDFSHAEGYATTASGSNSHAECNATTASGKCSHAEGGGTIASGACSHAEGYATTASGDFSHAEGKYNINNTTNKYSHIVGNGEQSVHSNSHTLDWQGNAVFAGTVSSASGADYAEYFEWADGNPDNEDRVGRVVTLEGEKIRYANSNDDILGIISGTAMVIGDNAEWEWKNKYKVDDFGRIIWKMEEEFIEVENHKTGEKEQKSIGFFPHRELNQEFDSTQEYIRRSDRKEWTTVGLLGKLHVLDDGTCKANGYAKVGSDGVLTTSTEKTNIRVMNRINANIVLVLLK